MRSNANWRCGCAGHARHNVFPIQSASGRYGVVWGNLKPASRVRDLASQEPVSASSVKSPSVMERPPIGAVAPTPMTTEASVAIDTRTAWEAADEGSALADGARVAHGDSERQEIW